MSVRKVLSGHSRAAIPQLFIPVTKFPLFPLFLFRFRLFFPFPLLPSLFFCCFFVLTPFGRTCTQRVPWAENVTRRSRSRNPFFLACAPQCEVPFATLPLCSTTFSKDQERTRGLSSTKGSWPRLPRERRQGHGLAHKVDG